MPLRRRECGRGFEAFGVGGTEERQKREQPWNKHDEGLRWQGLVTGNKKC